MCKFVSLIRTAHKKVWGGRASAVAQQDRRCLGSPGARVQSPAWHRWLRIWHFYSYGLGRDCSSDLIPGLGVPYAAGWPKMEKKKKKKKKVWGGVEGRKNTSG